MNELSIAGIKESLFMIVRTIDIVENEEENLNSLEKI